MQSVHEHELASRAVGEEHVGSKATLRPGERRPSMLDRLMFCAVLFILALTAIPYGTVDPWWESVFECLIFVLFGLWTCIDLWRGDWDITSRRLLIPLIAILSYALLQTITFRDPGSAWPTISADPYATRLLALKFLALVFAGLLLARYTSSRRRLRTLIYVVLMIAVGSAIFGIVRETTQHTAIGFGLPQLRPGSGYGQFINRNHFAYLMEMAFGLALGLILGKGEGRARLIYTAAALPILIALVLSNSRGGILSMFSQVTFLLLVFGAFGVGKGSTKNETRIESNIRSLTSQTPIRALLIIFLLCGMVVGVLWIGGDPLTKRLESFQSETSSEEGDTGDGGRRIQIWRASWKMFKDHPFTGIGFGGYWVAITEYYDVPGQKRPYQAHNDYLELLVSGGLLGMVLAAWFFVALLKQVRATLQTKDPFRRAACLGALTGLFGIAVHSIVDFGLHITINALVCVVLLVIVTIDKRVEKEKRSSERVRHRRKHAVTAGV